MLGTRIVKTLFNGAEFACVVSRFPTSIADYSKTSARMLLVIRVEFVVEILLWPLIWLLAMMIFALIPTSLNSPLFIVVFIYFLHCPFYIDSSVTHVFI